MFLAWPIPAMRLRLLMIFTLLVVSAGQSEYLFRNSKSAAFIEWKIDDFRSTN